MEGDYGDAGVVGGAEEQPEEGDYPEGNYGDAGTVERPAVQRPPARLRRTRRGTRRDSQFWFPEPFGSPFTHSERAAPAWAPLAWARKSGGVGDSCRARIQS